MTHARHFITKCRFCQKVLAQCRCAAVNKDLKYDVCGECAASRIEPDNTKVLFLDIDGVVNCASTPQRNHGFYGIDPTMANRVLRIIKETGCRVALSSTWRLSDEGIRRVERSGIELIGKTPNLHSGFRGAEVQAFLVEHPEITRYAILDDDADFEPTQPLFKTTWQEGLTEEIMLAVIKHLNHE